MLGYFQHFIIDILDVYIWGVFDIDVIIDYNSDTLSTVKKSLISMNHMLFFTYITTDF